MWSAFLTISSNLDPSYFKKKKEIQAFQSDPAFEKSHGFTANQETQAFPRIPTIPAM